MNNSVYYISLDIHDTASQTMLNVKKSDNGRQINFVLTDGGKPYVITEGCKAYFRALKPSKNLLFNECTIANNVITYILTNQTSAEVGIVDCEIRLNGADGKQITSPRFSLCVEDIIYSDSEVESQDEFTALQIALEKADKLIADISNKVDKVPGKDLSTNDFTTELKDKLDGMEEGANKTTVDAELSATSENPVQNKTVKAALDKKINKPKNISEGLFGFNSVGSETIREITFGGSSVEVDVSNIPNNMALKEYVASKTVNYLSKPTSNGVVGYMSGIGSLTYTLDTTMPDSPTNNSVPSTKLLGDKLKNALGMSDANLQKSGLLIQTYTPAGSTPGTVGTRTYSVIERDILTLDDTSTGMGKVPSSYVVGNYVKESISAEQSRTDNTFSNALKGSKSGGAFLIDDVSPVTHEMGVKVSSDTVEDLTAVKVKRCGKNLFDINGFINLKGNSTYYGINDNGELYVKKPDYRNDTIIPVFITLEAGTYTLSSTTAITSSFKLINLTDKKVIAFNNNNTFSIEKVTSLGIKCYQSADTVIGKLQLELGSTATDYEPYKECEEYTPTADGTINGVTSLYPNTTLTTDTEGVIINCKYNRDINKAFAALEAAIATNNS